MEDNSFNLRRFCDVVIHHPRTNFFVSLLIIVSVVSYSLTTLPNLDPKTTKFLHWLEVGIIVLFTIEYIFRVIAAASKTRFVLSFNGLVDLLVILPFYLSMAANLQALRLLRLIRLIKLMKLVRYSNAVNNLVSAIRATKDELAIFLLASLIVIYLAAFGIFHFENPVQPDVYRSIFDCLWWAVITLTTVGYGDLYPITVGGRVFTFLILMVGVGLVAVPTGLISSSLTSIKEKK